jgi:hypothetical protein
MQPTTSSFLTPLALKTAGAVLILSSLIDLVFMLLFPPENLGADSNQWWLYATSQLVDRGLLPLVGIAFVVTGDWIKIVSTEDGGNHGGQWRIGTYSLASILGLIFILIIPFQLMTTNSFKDKELKTITERVSQIENGLKTETQQINAQGKDKVKQQIALIDSELKSGAAQGQRAAELQLNKARLELFLNDPKKFAQSSDQNVQQLRKQRSKAESQANERMLKTGARTSLASLLLAIAYITIGWTGLSRVLR